MSQAFAAAGSIVAQQTVKPASTIICARTFTGLFGSSTNFFDLCGFAAETQATSSSGTYADVINISGRGVLLFCAFHGDSAGTTSAELTITIDGAGTPQLNAVATGGASMRCPVGAFSAVDTTNWRASVTFDAVYFSTSCRVQLRRASGSGTASCALKYRMLA